MQSQIETYITINILHVHITFGCLFGAQQRLLNRVHYPSLHVCMFILFVYKYTFFYLEWLYIKSMLRNPNAGGILMFVKC